MKIGQAAKQARISVEAVRFYEKQGLIKSPPRNESGYRVYSSDVIPQLLFVTRILLITAIWNAWPRESADEMPAKLSDVIQPKPTNGGK